MPSRPTPQTESSFRDRFPNEYRYPDANPYLIRHRDYGHPLYPASELTKHCQDWSALFGRDAPLHVEIGPGNGSFLVELAQRHPEWNVIGIEIRFKRCVITADKLKQAGLPHVIIGRYHAAYLKDLFSAGSLSGLYINHPDPWPKERHDKNRLISRWFLEDICSLLHSGGKLQLKSDFAPNCDRAVELIDHDSEGELCDVLPLQVTGRSQDIAMNGAPWPDDIITGYQQKMLVRGVPVHGVELVRI